MRPPLLWMGVRVGIAATTAVVSQTTRHESGMRVVPSGYLRSWHGTATSRREDGGWLTQHDVGVLLLQISRCAPANSIDLTQQ